MDAWHSGMGNNQVTLYDPFRVHFLTSIILQVCKQCLTTLLLGFTILIFIMAFVLKETPSESNKYIKPDISWGFFSNGLLYGKKSNKTGSTVTLKKYLLVDTPKCQIPQYVLEYPRRKESYDINRCKYNNSFSSISYSNQQAFLVIHYDALPLNTTCCYSVIARGKNTSKNLCLADSEYEIGECLKCDGLTPLSNTVQFLEVHCVQNINKTITFNTKNYHVVANITRTPRDSNRMNVILLGIRGLSRMAMLSSMPRTYSFLSLKGWADFRGITTINSSPKDNLFSLLTGYFPKDIKKRMKGRVLEEYPFIWKSFEDAGYVTALAEGDPYQSVFNIRSQGFKRSPTNYYLRPFLLSLKSRLSSRLSGPCEPKYFLYMQMALREYLRNQKGPLFSFFLFNDIKTGTETADDAYDESFFNFFQDLHTSGGLDNTVVVFFSEMGSRFGGIRESSIGWHQEKLPFTFIWTPTCSTLKNYYQAALYFNSGKLVNFIDVHLTLKHLIGNVSSHNSPNCHSLFFDVSPMRTCESIGISEKHCVCGFTSMTPTPTEVILKAVIVSINSRISDYEEKNSLILPSCPFYERGEVLRVHRLLPYRVCETIDTHLTLQVRLQPGNSIFSTNVKLSANLLKVSKTGTRLDGNTNCTNLSAIKAICSCVERPII